MQDPATFVESTIAGRLAARAARSRRTARVGITGLVAGAELLVDCLARRGTVLIAGNGGSAAEAQHLSSELVGRFRADRPGLRALALTVDTSALTAVGNDYGFEDVFSRQVDALGRPGDALVLLSTSGRSPNLLAAARTARSNGLSVVAISAGDGGPLAALSDVAILPPGGDTAEVQEDHLLIVHLLCEIIEHQMFGRDFGATETTSVVSIDELLALRPRWSAQGLRVVWTNGCFDLLHAGHLASLQAAAHEGDILVVGVNSDESVRRLKGAGRPVVPERQRAELLAGLGCVDHVVVLEDDEPSQVLERLRPDVHCKGSDYAEGGKPVPERAVVEAYGGRFVTLPLVPGLSTTATLARLQGPRGNSEP